MNDRPPVFHTVTVRVPPSGEVRLPGRYAHEFASMPDWWRTISGITSEFFAFPALDPASSRRLYNSIALAAGWEDDE